MQTIKLLGISNVVILTVLDYEIKNECEKSEQWIKIENVRNNLKMIKMKCR